MRICTFHLVALWGLVVVPISARCEPFTFQTSRTVDVAVKVISGRSPVALARVNLSSPKCHSEKCLDSIRPYAHYWKGVTNSNGEATISVVIPADERVLELSVDKPRMKGKYTTKRLRRKLGILAPSSLQRIKVKKLARSGTIVIKLKGLRQVGR